MVEAIMISLDELKTLESLLSKPVPKNAISDGELALGKESVLELVVLARNYLEAGPSDFDRWKASSITHASQVVELRKALEGLKGAGACFCDVKIGLLKNHTEACKTATKAMDMSPIAAAAEMLEQLQLAIDTIKTLAGGITKYECRRNDDCDHCFLLNEVAEPALEMLGAKQ